MLVERDKEALHQANAEYAQASADTLADLDPDLEKAAVNHLLEGDRDEDRSGVANIPRETASPFRPSPVPENACRK